MIWEARNFTWPAAQTMKVWNLGAIWGSSWNFWGAFQSHLRASWSHLRAFWSHHGAKLIQPCPKWLQHDPQSAEYALTSHKKQPSEICGKRGGAENALTSCKNASQRPFHDTLFGPEVPKVCWRHTKNDLNRNLIDNWTGSAFNWENLWTYVEQCLLSNWFRKGLLPFWQEHLPRANTRTHN